MTTMRAPTHARLRQAAREWLAEGRPAMIVSVAQTRGSTPREAQARMLVSAAEVRGTIGGGHLEWQAIDLARCQLRELKKGRALQGQDAPPGTPLPPAWDKTFALGPSLGQCCGGVVDLRFEALTDEALAVWPAPPSLFHLELHGAGHVGQAIVHLLEDIDCTVRWIDMRHVEEGWPGRPDEAWLAALPPHIAWLPSDEPEAEVADAPSGACHLVLTHRHDLDLKIIEAVLKRSDARLAGLIGSATKRARFLHRLTERGLSASQCAALVCPIGVPGIDGKAPAVIAIAVVAQLLMQAGAGPAQNRAGP